MREKIFRFMYGRYGVDSLGYFLMWLTIGDIILNLFIKSGVLDTICLVLIIYSYYRMLSKNIAARSRENTFYLKHTVKIRRLIKRMRMISVLKKKYRIFRCPECSLRVKIPKRKGRVEITCPKCRNRFIRRS